MPEDYTQKTFTLETQNMTKFDNDSFKINLKFTNELKDIFLINSLWTRNKTGGSEWFVLTTCKYYKKNNDVISANFTNNIQIFDPFKYNDEYKLIKNEVFQNSSAHTHKFITKLKNNNNFELPNNTNIFSIKFSDGTSSKSPSLKLKNDIVNKSILDRNVTIVYSDFGCECECIC